jgi:hypothetical protein
MPIFAQFFLPFVSGNFPKFAFSSAGHVVLLVPAPTVNFNEVGGAAVLKVMHPGEKPLRMNKTGRRRTLRQTVS